MTDKLARHDWVRVRQEVQSGKSNHYGTILPWHVHNMLGYVKVRKIEHQLTVNQSTLCAMATGAKSAV